MPPAVKAGLHMEDPWGKCCSRSEIFLIFQTALPTEPCCSTTASLATIASRDVETSCTPRELIVSSRRTSRMSTPTLTLSLARSTSGAMGQKFECPWPIRPAYSSSSGDRRKEPTQSWYLMRVPLGHHRKREQNPSYVVFSRPFGKNSNWRPSMPATRNLGDQTDCPLASSASLAEKPLTVHSTLRRNWSPLHVRPTTSRDRFCSSNSWDSLLNSSTSSSRRRSSRVCWFSCTCSWFSSSWTLFCSATVSAHMP
mmetsp:Transcript_15119/g.45272  ORF Transcript_15119/g.45272 Transcript_15119/m.45272 type:complete len:254 (+) Transcript_15119:348-1109(+)